MELSTGTRDLLRAMYVPSILLMLLWASKGIEVVFGISFGMYGIYPQTLEGIPGIILSPLIHSNLDHLVSNSVPLFILSTTLFYFYRPLAFKIITLLWVVTGLCVWIGGRNAYHIGASGLIYGEASFLFFSGIVRKNPKLAAISFLVIFLYGGMVWGIFPFFPEISWESHLFGGLAGLTFALIYRNEGPQNIEIKEPDEDEDEFPYDWHEYNENENLNFWSFAPIPNNGASPHTRLHLLP